MNIPFLSFFKRKIAKEPAPVAPAPTPVEKPSSERLSKTVMPNATRSVPPQDPFHAAANVSQAMPGAPAPGAPRTISFGSPAAPASRPSDLPPAVALALEPKVERVISLELVDVVGQIPAGVVRPLENSDVSRRILLKASEVEKGMASGKPSVSLSTIYQQAPEIFTRAVAPSDATQVQLPFQKVLEQFNSLQVRGDQHREQAVPQVETPFLKVTLEDNTRFGILTAPVQTGELPPVRLQPATAESLAAAEPEPATQEKSTPPAPLAAIPLRVPLPSEPRANGSAEAPPTPARLPFKLTPKGTDEPAPERVPASSGPSVPTSSRTPAPARIPFKISAPSDDIRPKEEGWLTKENFAPEAEESIAEPPAAALAGAKKEEGRLKIALALKPILESLPPFQLTGDITKVADDARLELPFSLVEPQLASGRVVVKPEDFAAGLPEQYRGLFNVQETAATVSLPLHELLKNLPTASLRMRQDQVEQEKGEDFATPFSAKAEEDAKRFKVAGTPVARPVPAKAEEKAERPTSNVQLSTSHEANRTALQTALDTDDELDAKAVVAHVGRMAGVKACAIMFGDGLSLAGNLPDVYEADGLCAMAPSLLQRIDNHMVETKLGALRAMTLSCSKAAVTFFMHDNLCLAALHAKDELASDVRERLARAVHELSKKYSTAA